MSPSLSAAPLYTEVSAQPIGVWPHRSRVAGAVVDWVRDHPWSDEAAIRAGVGRASRMHGELTDLEGRGALIRCREFDARVGRDIWLFALPDTPPPTAGEISETPKTQEDARPSTTPFADLDRALALLDRFEARVIEQDAEIVVLRAERDEARQTALALTQATISRPVSPLLPERPCVECQSAFRPRQRTWRGEPVERCPTCLRRNYAQSKIAPIAAQICLDCHEEWQPKALTMNGQKVARCPRCVKRRGRRTSHREPQETG